MDSCDTHGSRVGRRRPGRRSEALRPRLDHLSGLVPEVARQQHRMPLHASDGLHEALSQLEVLREGRSAARLDRRRSLPKNRRRVRRRFFLSLFLQTIEFVRDADCIDSARRGISCRSPHDSFARLKVRNEFHFYRIELIQTSVI